MVAHGCGMAEMGVRFPPGPKYGIERKTEALLEKYVQNPNLKKHTLCVAALMKALSKRILGENVSKKEEEIWEVAGLLHDLDWEMTKDDFQKHSLISAEILEKESFPKEIVEAVRKHNPVHNLKLKTLLEKALYCTEEITGLIVATALVMPNKKLSEVKVETVLEKFKEKSFAKGVNRELILKSKELLNLELEELVKIALKAMQEISEKLGL